MTSVIRTLAWQTWLEARHGHLLAMLLALAALGTGLRWFISAVALIDPEASGLAITAPAIRLIAVMVIASLAAHLICREFGDRRIDLLLSAPISRTTWVAGRMLGIMLIATTVSAFAAIALMGGTPLTALFAWTGSLAMELSLVGSLAITVSVALKRLVPSLVAVLLLYVGARLTGIIELLAHSDIPGLADSGLAGWVASTLLNGLPRLGNFTATEWLLGPVADQSFMTSLAGNAAQAGVSITILLLVCVVDFSRDLD